MNVYVKPIQPTPTLSGEDAKRIVAQVLIVPSKGAIEKNKKMLKLRKQIVKE